MVSCMATVFIFHGTKGLPEGNWFPWLAAELATRGHEVILPRFPTPENQSLENWFKALEPYNKKLPNAILVGHSLAPAFILRLLERGQKIKAAFLVAPFLGEIGNEEYDELNKTFVGEFDWEKIRENCGHFEVFFSENDPYVPMKMEKEVADKLGVKPTIIKGGGHLNAESGYTEFPLLLQHVLSVIS